MPTIAIAATEIGEIGGINRFVQTIALGFAGRGWNVHCIATNLKGDHFDALRETVCCHDLSTLRLSPKKAFLAAELVNSIRPEILVLNNCALLHYALPCLHRSIKPVVVLHSDDSRFYDIAALFSHRVFRWVAPTVGLVRPFTTYINSRRHGDIVTIPHAVVEYGPERVREKLPNSKIAFVGFLGENKGAQLLPEIFAAVVRDQPNAFLTIVGEGPLRTTLEKIFLSRRYSNQISFAGAVPHARVYEILRETQVLLHPTEIEGFGLILAEAMSCGAVPVVTLLPGITDSIVHHGHSGYLVKSGDINGFAAAVARILGDEDLFTKMSSEAKTEALRKFSVHDVLDQYERLFSQTDTRTLLTTRSSFGWYWETSIEVIKRKLR